MRPETGVLKISHQHNFSDITTILSFHKTIRGGGLQDRTKFDTLGVCVWIHHEVVVGRAMTRIFDGHVTV